MLANHKMALFRESRIQILEFFGSAEQQIEWQGRTPTLDSTECMLWWIDDFYPDSALFKASFSRTEIAMLSKFDELFHSATDKHLGSGPKVEQLLQESGWNEVMMEANRIASMLRNTPI
jgi:hypothetical protein